VKFKKAVEETPDIKAAFCSGLQALRRSDRQHVSAQDTNRLAGSVDIDTTVKDQYPNDSRWDYAIGHRPTNFKEEFLCVVR
jgi:hypothetical protein